MSAFETSASPDSEALFAALSSQFLAAIPENGEEVENLSREFLGHTLAANRGGAPAMLVDQLVEQYRC